MSHGESLGRGATGVNLREAVWHEPMATRRVGIFAWTAE
jgi:ureidoglycolate hydrolase